MAIIRFTFDRDKVPADAENVREHTRDASYSDGTSRTETWWTWEEYRGLCLEEGEVNMRDDSDFYMVVWNPEKKAPFRDYFASTRGWSYPSYASYADATPEVRAEYEAYRRQHDRDRRAAELRRQRSVEREQRSAANLSRKQYRDLREAVHNNDIFEAILRLLSSEAGGRLRSQFRMSIAEQVRRWLDGDRKYPTPLSRKQMEFV